MGICALLVHVVWLTEASENPAGGGGESRTRPGGDIPFFLDQGGVIFRIVLSELCSIQTKICFRQALEGGMIFLPFYPKLVGVKEMVLFVKVDLRMNCFFKLSLNN